MRAVAGLALTLLACDGRRGPPDARPPEATVVVDAARALPPPLPAAPPGWADVTAVIPDAVLDARYAAADNVLGRPFAPARCLLRERVAARLARAATALRVAGYRLVLWDCYRTPAAQAALWAHRPDPRYVAEPRTDGDGRPTAGSRHTRGAAVDVSLADAAGVPLAMPTAHDEFSAAAHRSHALAGDGAAARHARALDAAMTRAGFVGVASEWWHYDDPDGASSPLADLDLAPKEPAR